MCLIPQLVSNSTLLISGGCLNIKMQTYQDNDFHYKDKIVSWPSCPYNGNIHTWKDSLYIETGPWFHRCALQWHQMSIMTSQIFGNSTICSTAFSYWQQNNTSELHITGPLWCESTSDSSHKGPVMGKVLPCHDVINNYSTLIDVPNQPNPSQSLYSLSSKTSYCKTPWNIKTMRLEWSEQLEKS